MATHGTNLAVPAVVVPEAARPDGKAATAVTAPGHGSSQTGGGPTGWNGGDGGDGTGSWIYGTGWPGGGGGSSAVVGSWGGNGGNGVVILRYLI